MTAVLSESFDAITAVEGTYDIIITSNYEIIQLNSDRNIRYLMEGQLYEVPDNIGGEIARKWYRNRDNIDTYHSLFSMGLTIERRLGFALTNFIRFYLALEYWVSKVDKITILGKPPCELRKAAECFDGKIIFLNNACPSTELYRELDLFLSRAVICSIKIHPLSFIVRKFQQLFPFFFQKKVLLFSDWTLSKVKSKKIIRLNNQNIFKGFYFGYASKYISIAEKSIEKSLDESALMANISPILVDFKHSNNFPSLLTKTLEVIESEYKSARSNAIQIYASCRLIFEDYNPKSIVLPGCANATYAMIMQIAKEKHVPVVVALDGFLSYISKYEFYIDKDGDDMLVKNFAAMGYLSVNLLNRINYNFSSIKCINPPIFDHNYKKNFKRYDVIILLPYPAYLNIRSRWDFRFEYILEVVKCLQLKGLTRLAIKIKQGVREGETLNHIEEIINKNKNKNKMKNVEVLTGPLSEVLSSAEIMIGSMSTAIFESVKYDIPYYVYEPYYCGVSDSDIVNSTIYGNYIARDVKDLEFALENKKNITFDKKLMTGESALIDIDFDKLSS